MSPAPNPDGSGLPSPVAAATRGAAVITGATEAAGTTTGAIDATDPTAPELPVPARDVEGAAGVSDAPGEPGFASEGERCSTGVLIADEAVSVWWRRGAPMSGVTVVLSLRTPAGLPSESVPDEVDVDAGALEEPRLVWFVRPLGRVPRADEDVDAPAEAESVLEPVDADEPVVSANAIGDATAEPTLNATTTAPTPPT